MLRPLTGAALEKLQAQPQALKEGRAELKEKGPERSRVGAESGNIGKVVKKAAPSLPDFSLEPGGLPRALFDPSTTSSSTASPGRGAWSPCASWTTSVTARSPAHRQTCDVLRARSV